MAKQVQKRNPEPVQKPRTNCRQERATAQEIREMENRERRRSGQLTPWQQARRVRSERRAADPAVQKRRVQHEKELNI